MGVLIFPNSQDSEGLCDEVCAGEAYRSMQQSQHAPMDVCHSVWLLALPNSQPRIWLLRFGGISSTGGDHGSTDCFHYMLQG